MTTTTVTTTTAGTAVSAHGRVAAWLVLLGMGGTSLTYNISHAIGGHLSVGLAVLYGLAPVGAAMGLSHIVAACRGGWLMRTITVIVMLGAMGLSVGATAAVVAPVAPGALRFVFPAVMDAASLLALQVILTPRRGPVAPATMTGGAWPHPATSTATTAATIPAAAPPAPVVAPAAPAAGSRPGPGDDARRIPAQRGEIRRVMREHWESEVDRGRIPNGADLNRAADKDPDYSLGKRYAAEWRDELPSGMDDEMPGEWRGGPVAAGARR